MITDQLQSPSMGDSATSARRLIRNVQTGDNMAGDNQFYSRPQIQVAVDVERKQRERGSSTSWAGPPVELLSSRLTPDELSARSLCAPAQLFERTHAYMYNTRSHRKINNAIQGSMTRRANTHTQCLHPVCVCARDSCGRA
jgi:hypothetical protein